MRLAFFDTHNFERKPFEAANLKHGHQISYFQPRLSKDTASLAFGFEGVCAFANDRIDRDAIGLLKQGGVKIVALRSAGFNQVDLQAADDFDLPVVRVPEYSPYAVAEHALGLILAMNRHIHRAYQRVREMNFSLDGLVGFDLHGKTVGIIGTGRIGRVFAKIMNGLGCKILAFDLVPDQDLINSCQVSYVTLKDLLSQSRIISLHVPLNSETHHMIDEEAFQSMQKGVGLVNTSRGGLVKTSALIAALKRGQIGFAALDVYEEEEGIFFHDLSEAGVDDDVLARLLTFPQVLITAHQAFLTEEALANIAQTTLESLSAFERDGSFLHRVRLKT